MALDFFAGCLGGCAGVVIGHPFDTVKVKLQMQDYRNPLYRGTLDCFTKILKAESVAGVFRGVSSPMAGVAVVNAIVFGVYGNVQRNMTEPNSLQAHFLAGAAAGLAQSIVASPVELVKSRVQISNLHNSPWDCFKKIYRRDGTRAVFRGLGITGARDFMGYGLYFATYETLTKMSPGDAPIGTASMLLAGGLSGTISWIFTYPLDVVKTRLQVDEGKYSSFSDCIKKSVRSEGIMCLTKGLAPTLMRAFPSNAVTFAVVTWVFRLAALGLESSENLKTEVKSSYETTAGSAHTIRSMRFAEVCSDYSSLPLEVANDLAQSMTLERKSNVHEINVELESLQNTLTKFVHHLGTNSLYFSSNKSSHEIEKCKYIVR